jgi:hypothetical protein
MGQSISPIAYRVGFFRSWDSLYTESLYFRNYNFFIKSQLLSYYVQSFFNKWTWDGRRSYFLNFIYSHLEISWSYNYINLYVYIYNTGIEYLHFNLKKKIYYLNKNFSEIVNFFSFFKIKGKDLALNINSLVFSLSKNMNFFFKYIHLGSFLRYFFSKKKHLKYQKYYRKKIDLKIEKKKKAFKKLKFIIRRIAVFKKHFFSKQGLVTRYGINFKLKNKKKYLKNFIYVYVFLKKLMYLRYFRSYLNFSNYFFFVKPLENVFRRHFFKDFYHILGLGKTSLSLSNFNISFIRLIPQSITSSTYGRHIWLKLYKKYNFGRVISNLLRSVSKSNFLKGLLVSCNGRFTKKQRAWHKVYRYGRMSLNRQNALVDDSLIFVKLKYGVASVHINLNYT